MALHPLVPLNAFEEWEIDFIGPINLPTKKARNEHILVVVNHVTKWAEARVLKTDNAKNVAIFLYENIIVRFG